MIFLVPSSVNRKHGSCVLVHEQLFTIPSETELQKYALYINLHIDVRFRVADEITTFFREHDLRMFFIWGGLLTEGLISNVIALENTLCIGLLFR